MMVLLHRKADSPVVDDRYHFPEMFGKHAEKQNLIAVVQCGQIDILAQGIRQPLVLGIRTRHLGFERADHWRKQSGEPQSFPFLKCEGGAFIQERGSEYGHSAGLGLIAAWAREV